jgi:hypothetical protein
MKDKFPEGVAALIDRRVWVRLRVQFLGLFAVAVLAALSVVWMAAAWDYGWFGSTMITWTGQDGQRVHGWIATDTYLHFQRERQQALAADCQALAASSGEGAKAGLTTALGAIKDNSHTYADWLFGWNSSYSRDRRMLSIAATSAYEKAGTGDWSTIWPQVEQDLHDDIKSTFRALVLEPERNDPLLSAAWEQSLAAAEAARIRTSDAHRQANSEFLDANARRVPGFIWPLVAPLFHVLADDASNTSRLVPFRAEDVASPTTADLLRSVEDPSQEALLRAPRPMLARATGLIVRSAAGLSMLDVTHMVMDVTDLGLLAAGPGLMLGVGTAMLTAIGLDFLMSSADEMINRREFEAALTNTLSDASTALADEAAARIGVAIARSCRGPGTEDM